MIGVLGRKQPADEGLGLGEGQELGLADGREQLPYGKEEVTSRYCYASFLLVEIWSFENCSFTVG